MNAAFLHLSRPHPVKEFRDSLDLMQAYDRLGHDCFGGRIAGLKHAPYPNLGRNSMTNDAFRLWPDIEAVVWGDDDMGFEEDAPHRLLQLLDDEHPIVSALYFAAESNGKVRPLVYDVAQSTDDRAVTMWQYPRNKLVRTWQVGMGLCAIRAKELVRWAELHGPTWFDYMTTPRGRFMIEDSSFSSRMRSQGSQIWVHTGIQAKHWKTVGLGEEHYEAQNALQEKRSAGGIAES